MLELLLNLSSDTITPAPAPPSPDSLYLSMVGEDILSTADNVHGHFNDNKIANNERVEHENVVESNNQISNITGDQASEK